MAVTWQSYIAMKPAVGQDGGMNFRSPFVIHLLWCGVALGTGVTGYYLGREGKENGAVSLAARGGVVKAGASADSGNKKPVTGPAVEEKNPAAAAVLREAKPGEVNAALLRSMNAVLEEQDEEVRTAKWIALLAAMRKEDAVAVRGIFLENDKRGRWFIPEWKVFWKKFGELDGPAALDEWNATGNKMDQDSPGRIIAAAIKARGSEEMARLLEREDIKTSPQRMGEVAKAYASLGPDEAMSVLKSDAIPEQYRDVAARAIVTAGIERGGVESAAQTMQSLVSAGVPESALRSAFSTVLFAAERGGVERLQEVALEHLNQPWCDGQTLTGVTLQLSAKSPAAALEFITRLPVGQADQSIRNMVSQSTASDPQFIGNWLTEHGNTPHYDRIAAAYSEAIREVDPGAADAWAKTIKDPALRPAARPGQ